MELKNVNPNGGNVIASNLNNLFLFLFLFQIVKIKFEFKNHMLLFVQYVLIAYKKEILLLFSPLINFE
jgi:hypothetical protein